MKKLLKIQVIIALVFIAVGFKVSEADIFSNSNISVGGNNRTIIADVNGDGYNDVIADAVYLSDGNGNFINYYARPGDPITNYTCYDTKDLDNDGDLDFVTCSTGGCEIYFNDGTGYFTLNEIYNVSPGGVYDCRAADLNNDGFIDIVVPGHGYDYPANILWNQKDGTFVIQDISPYGTGCGVDIGDYDNDGDFDILWSNNMSTTRIHNNDGRGGFSTGYQFHWNYVTGSPISTFTDLNSDGFLDAIILSSSDSGGAYIYLNNGDGTYSNISSFPNYRINGVLKTVVMFKSADIDNDGDDDIGVNYLNDGNGNLTLSEESWTHWWGLGDLNGDGFLDMASDYIYYNTLGASQINTSPTIPDGLTATITETSITFQWNPSSDDVTPETLLKYNLRVGTTPDNNDIMSGVTPGWYPNVEHNTSWTLYLDMNDVCKVYWSVQSQDGSYSRSEWAGEQVAIFNGCNAPPVFQAIGSQGVEEGSTLEFYVSAIDPDGDNVTLTHTDLPDGAYFDEIRGLFSWTPNYIQEGIYIVTFTATDDWIPSESAEMGVVITVGDVSDSCTLSNVLVDEISNNSDIEKGMANSLISTLKQVCTHIEDNKIKSSINKLCTFIKKIEVHRSHDEINDLTADYYSAVASDIISNIGGEPLECN